MPKQGCPHRWHFALRQTRVPTLGLRHIKLHAARRTCGHRRVNWTHGRQPHDASVCSLAVRCSAERRASLDRVVTLSLGTTPAERGFCSAGPHRRCSSMAEHQLPKLNTRVRFPSSAPDRSRRLRTCCAALALDTRLAQLNQGVRVLFGPGRFGRRRTSPSRRRSSSHPCGRAIRRPGRRAPRGGA
jgi:hypothetical protein